MVLLGQLTYRFRQLTRYRVTLFVGLDLAWHGSDKPSGLAIMTGDERGVTLMACHSVNEDKEILDILNGMDDADIVLAIDAPLIINNSEGQRCCETRIGRQFGHAHTSAHTTNLGRFPSRRSLLLVDGLKEAGWIHDVAQSQQAKREAKWMFEVYPHPAHVVLFDRAKIISYKKGKLGQRRAGLAEFRNEIVAKLADADLPLGRNQILSEFTAVDIENLSGKQLKAFEDTVDAVLCAYLAAHYWAFGSSRNKVIGSMERGYIVVPTTTTAGKSWSFRRETIR